MFPSRVVKSEEVLWLKYYKLMKVLYLHWGSPSRLSGTRPSRDTVSGVTSHLCVIWSPHFTPTETITLLREQSVTTVVEGGPCSQEFTNVVLSSPRLPGTRLKGGTWTNGNLEIKTGSLFERGGGRKR